MNKNKYGGYLLWAVLPIIFNSLNTFNSKAQSAPENQVPNPSFEQYIYCPYQEDQLVENVVGWLEATRTTPDHFHACNNSINGNYGVPNNARGIINAYEGSGYAGIVTYWNDNPYGGSYDQWREYLQTSFYMEEGIEYDISFRVALSSISGWSTKNLGVNISNNYTFQDNYKPIELNPTFEHSQQITTTSSWTELSFTYTPQSSGTYYLMIGDFSEFNDPQPTANNGLDGYAYYYIDDVSVTAEGCCPEHLNIDNITYPNGTETTVAAGTITAGNNVVVANGATVNYIASSTIELTDGFSTELGAEFSASIAACPPQFQQRTVQQFPNVITPNGDGFNDELCILANGGSNWSIEIYNQWGNLLYASGGPITELPICVWDGDCNQPFPHCTGAPISDGTYYGIFKLEGCDMPDEAFAQNIYVQGAQYKMAEDDGKPERHAEQEMERTGVSESTLEFVGLEDNSKLKPFIYPNPSIGVVTLNLPGNSGSSILQVFDALGELVWRMGPTELSTLNIDLSSHPSGVYLLRALNSEKVFTERFVIK
jgi:hypothetical protein